VVADNKQQAKSKRNRGRKLLGVISTTIAALSAVGGVFPMAARAQSSAKDPQIIEAKPFGAFDGANQAVVRVTVRSPKPVTGILRCECNHGAIVTTRLELPTGGEKTVWLPMGQIASYDSRTIIWDVPGGSDPSLPIVVQPGFGQRAMAVLPSALGSRKAPTSVSARARGGSIEVADVSLDDIEQRGWILEGFTVVATTSKELKTLSTDAQRAVFDWVNRGGELLVDDDDPVPLIAKQPTVQRNAIVGLGIVRRTANATRTGQWESVMLPGIRAAKGNNSGYNQFQEVPVSLKSAIKLAPVGALLAGLVVYALATGPLAYSLGQKRKKPMLMWIAVPLASLLTTVAVVGIGFALRRTAHDQVVRYTLHGLADRTTVARAVSEGSTARNIKLPTGWTASSSDIKLDVGVGITSSVDLRPGQIKEVRFTGTTAAGGAPFEVTFSGDQITVKNLTGNKLTHVVAFSSIQGQLSTQPLKDVAGSGTESASLNFSPFYFSGSFGDVETGGLLSLVQSNMVLREGPVIVVAEVEGDSSNPSIPNALLINAKPLRSIHAVSALPDFRVQSQNSGGVAVLPQSVGNLRRFDLGDHLDADYSITGLTYSDTIWIGDQEVPAVSGPLPEGAVQNGVVLINSATAELKLGS
jgi:hypothetical protein